jgi:hypothetical protein
LTNSVKRIYNQSFASLVVDKYISDQKIYVLGGIKQGCALSMFAYTLGIEELAQESILASILGKTWQVAGSCKFLQDGRLSRI